MKILPCKLKHTKPYREGLRTLVISQKLIEDEFFEQWIRRYNHAKTDLNERDRLMTECILELEQDMELLGITGVEGTLSRPQ